MRDLLRGIRAVAALDDGTRQRIYAFVRAEARPVTREEVAARVGISRKLAAFHLDKLLDRGLLAAHYARPPGRSGPGAGRSSKMYQPSDIEIEISIPRRRYDALGEILVDAIEHQNPGESSRDAATRVAKERGRAVGDGIRRKRSLRTVAKRARSRSPRRRWRSWASSRSGSPPTRSLSAIAPSGRSHGWRPIWCAR